MQEQKKRSYLNQMRDRKEVCQLPPVRGPVREEAYNSANTSPRLDNEVMQQTHTCTWGYVLLFACITYLFREI